MSGDEGDYWRDVKPILKRESRERRERNRDGGMGAFLDHHIAFTSHNNGAHLVVQGHRHIIDYWPGTGLWIVRGQTGRYRGVKSLLDFVLERGL